MGFFCFFFLLIAVPVIVLNLIIVWNSFYTSRSHKKSQRKIKVTHRGFIDSWPENTIEAILCSYRNEFIPETDVDITKDGQFVLFHDRTVARMTNNESSLEIQKNSYDLLSKVQIPQNIFNMKYKSTSCISLLTDLFNEMNKINNNNRINGIYLDLKGITRTFYASKADKIYNKGIIEIISSSTFAKQLNFTFYFACYNPGAINDFYYKWKQCIKRNTEIVCKYQFIWYVSSGKSFNLEYFLLKTKIWQFLMPMVDGFVCDDGLFNLYYNEILKGYKETGYSIGYWEQYGPQTDNNKAHIQILNLPTKAWKTIVENNGYSAVPFEQIYTHQTALLVYQAYRVISALSWLYIMYIIIYCYCGKY